MIVDTSVIICLLREEPETARFVPLLLANFGKLKMSAANFLEACIVIDSLHDEVLAERLEFIISHFGIEVLPVTVWQVTIARRAYAEYGKGNGRARLNFGDTFAYALSMDRNEPLLFKGDDFSQTDVMVATRP